MTTTSEPAGQKVPPLTVLTALGPFALGYFFSYLFRAVNAVVAPDLVADVGLTAAELGLVTSAYLFAFAAFQLPLGLLLDRYGPRRVQAVLVCCAAAGALLFGLGRDVATLTAARALIGLGFAGGLMSGFKAVVLWVPEPRRPLANACVMSFGALGLLVATLPMEWAVQAWGWRDAFIGLAGLCVAVALIIFLVVPERRGTAEPEPLGRQLAGLGGIFRARAFWVLAPLLMSTAGSHIAIQTLWAGPWLRDVAGLDRDGVASTLFAMAAGFLVGVLGSGAVADVFVRRGVSVLTVMLGFLAVFFAVQLGILLEWTGIGIALWVVFGMTGQVAILAYPWLSSHFGAALSGRANTAMNLLIFGTAFAVQYALGGVIDLFPAGPDGGYAPEAYQLGFAILLGLQLLALAWFFAGRRALGARAGDG
ncbi:MAG: MFS transporter [Kiloniellales bacterium]|nr:MFS transporter [Kiloniellales bacterium]